MQIKRIKKHEVQKKLGVSSATVDAYVNRKHFPKPAKRGTSTFWDNTEVEAWIALDLQNEDYIKQCTPSCLKKMQVFVNKYHEDMRKSIN